MEYAIGAAILGILYFLWNKITGFFLSKKSQHLTEEIKELKSEADKKTAVADESADDLQRMYDEYKKSQK